MTFILSVISDTRFFPTVMIAISVGAGLRYAVAHDVRHAVYWFAAAILTTTVTW